MDGEGEGWGVGLRVWRERDTEFEVYPFEWVGEE